MGQEVVWHLRFNRGDELVALLRPEALGQAENALYVETQWRLETTPENDWVRAVFKRG